MSFQQGISGLNATAKNLEVIGNNIANANTVGSKTSRTEFADVYATSLGGGGGKISGIGVAVASVAQEFSQGSIRSTNNPLDLAISGNGFFQVKGPDAAVHYTRNGEFKLDRQGRVSNTQGDVLMGYAADSAGIVQPGQARELLLTTGAIAPKSTTRVDITANLDSRATITRPLAAPFIDIRNAGTYNNATSVTAIDGNGKDVAVTYYFQKTAAEVWDVYATANGNMMGGTNALPVPIQTISFPPSGVAPTSPTASFTQLIPAGPVVGGVGTMMIPNVEMDFSAFTQFASPFGVTQLSQDGYTAGALTGVSVESTGLIRANYSNGQAKSIGQIELATFVNMNGLQPLGGNKWARSIDSGEAVLGVPGSGNLGALQTSALEDSNVDLTAELVSMMVAQRIYQANAQTIKTQDQVLQTLVNLR